ncbi:MAG: oligoendopeptidase F [Ignavibacteria bacterium]|nr:oligoendopeptidase F [Ignavibacteria bacterium]
MELPLGYKLNSEELLNSNLSAVSERERTKIADTYKWNLADIYLNDEVWKSHKDKLVTELPSVEQFRGKLSDSPQVLLECLELISRLSKEYARLYCYASMHSDQDTREAKYLGMVQDMGHIGSDFSAKIAFVQPEILKMAGSVIDSFIKDEPKLGIYRHNLDDILRRKEHTGTEREEKIIADASLMADAPNSIYNIFSDADFPFAEVTLSDGKIVKLDKAAFGLYRAVSNREDRKKVFGAYFNKLNDYRRTFGAQLYSEVKKNLFYMKARRYETCLQRALDSSNIPLEVFHSLIDNVNANLATFHRYLNLRKRMLGVTQLHYYDLYAPLVNEVDLDYSFEDSQRTVLVSLTPLGDEYMAVVSKGLNEQWVDVYPTEGKRSGAYSNGAIYDLHPYILLNYNGKYEDMRTLAHELGHTMHSYLTNKTQPYATSGYSIFVAEVASTFNEDLLMGYMLKNIKDDDVRLSLLGNYLDGIRGTAFRQTQFSEFELKIHELAERGESLTGDLLNTLYDAIIKKYYGHDKGICIIDDEAKAEWANVPHFYYNFYVYQYATSFTASAALSEQVLAGDRLALKRFLDLLSAGGSDYPINLLKRAGVDMTTSLPFELTMKKMNRVMDEMEKILDKEVELEKK